MTSYALRAECRGHEDDVRAAVVLSPASFATASRDKTVRVWSEAIGSDVSFAQSVVCVGHASFVTSLAFAPPGRVPSFPPLGALVSGSRDARVVAWDPATGDAVAEMRGHALDVTAVCVLASGVVVSGAMDKSVRVWDPKTGACARAIEDAHGSSVLALAALADGGFLSGSADRSVKRWDGQMPYDGASWKPTTTMTGHADTVRGICVTPAGDAFLTASHDCTARMWSLVTHETVLTFVGHTALVYAVAAAGDRVFTGSEDNTMRIWRARDASCAQTIAHPGCVWSVAAFPIGGDGNGGGGDVISCCADGVARVWTTDDAKKDAAAAKAMDDAMTAAAEARARATLAEEQSKIKTEDPSALLQSGHGDGVTKVIREEGGTIAAYAWSAGTASWERVGEVTGVGGGGIGGGKKSFQGAEYDYVFDVDFQDGVPPLKLPFNVGDNPYTAAETFLETNDLPAGYREQVVNFIVQNVGETNVGAGGVSADPFTGAGAYVPGTGATTGGGGGGAGNFDPFTGGGAYVPGAAAAPAAAAPAAAAAAARQSYVPTTTCLLFDTSLNLDGILKKIAEFAAELATAAQRVEGLRECAAAAASKTPPSTTAAAALLDASAAWPKEKLFPLLDVARMLVLVPGACDAATSGAFAAAACRALESGGDGAPAPPGNVLTAGRLFANAFKHGETRDAFLPFGQALLDGLAPAAAADAKPPARLALATAILNLASFASDIPAAADLAPACVAVGSQLLYASPAADVDARFRALVALGTAATTAGAEAKKLAIDLGVLDVATALAAAESAGKVKDAAADVRKALS